MKFEGELLHNAKLAEKYLHDQLIYDFRTKRHLSESYNLDRRFGGLFDQFFVDVWKGKSYYLPNGYNVKGGVVTVRFFTNYVDPLKGVEPIHTVIFDTNIWRGEYKAKKRENRFKKILDI
ncbi:MAG: hypothetical protein SLAVMIC_00999 [uncultured marine phage]|uniref:Uncharacterized protein n=1 Tax=uncultured marine phage TaxID=707152 RepID=A0A8D9CF58_9VIRU|nr:MAG: hypothetical protein SLAVMIC_00999 [uncultured marine phage]